MKSEQIFAWWPSYKITPHVLDGFWTLVAQNEATVAYASNPHEFCECSFEKHIFVAKRQVWSTNRWKSSIDEPDLQTGDPKSFIFLRMYPFLVISTSGRLGPLRWCEW